MRTFQAAALSLVILIAVCRSSSAGPEASRSATAGPAAQATDRGAAGSQPASQPAASASEDAAPGTQPATASEEDASTMTQQERFAVTGRPYKVPASQPGQRCNLVWRKFPARFGDYFCIQGLVLPVTPNPKPAFCKADKPLLVDDRKGTITSTMLFDQSQPGGPYDTLYVDFNDNGDFLDDPVYHARAYRGVGLEGRIVWAYFENVQVVRFKPRNMTAHVQVFLQDNQLNSKKVSPCRAGIIPQRWAVGTVQLKGRSVPAAIVDRNWNDSAIDQVGLNLSEYKDKYPRGDYLFLEPDGGEELRPGTWPGIENECSPRTILNEYLQIGADTYKVKVAQCEEGVQLDLVPAEVPMGWLRVRGKSPNGRVIGLKTSLLMRGPASPVDPVPVPADTYAFFGLDNAIGEAATVEAGQTTEVPKQILRPAEELARPLAVGQDAPAMEVRRLDGEPLKMGDYKGKVVLLDFWASWCGPCVEEIPNLKAVYDRFGKNARFAMISLSLDNDVETVRAFLQKQAMPWVQGFIEEKDRAEVTKKYGVRTIPTTLLIGSDGKVAAAGLRGETAAEAVAKALSEGAAGKGSVSAPGLPSGPQRSGGEAKGAAEGQRIAGTVLLPDGKPGAGVGVYVSTQDRGLYVHNGSVTMYGSTKLHTQADGEGRFSLPAPGRAFVIAAVSDAGYGEASQARFEETPQIQMRAWARIEGALRIGAKPGAGEPIVVHAPGDYETRTRNAPSVEHDYEVMTDAAGEFIIERVVPKDVVVAHKIETSLSRKALVFAEPGKTYQVTLGGTGRPVAGRIIVPEEVAAKIDWRSCLADVSVVLPELPIPEPIKAKGGLAMRDWEAAWLRTPEGKARRLADRQYDFRILADGVFRVEDLPAGTYRLYCDLESNRDGKGEVQTIGRVDYEFEVAAMPGGRSDKVLDLGDVEAAVFNKIDIGSAAAPFEVKTFDGQTIKSTDYRGRCMLLTFWSARWWDNTKETGNLRTVYERFGKDGRLAMISFNIDDKPDEARKHIEQNDLRWPQAYLGSLDKTLLPGAYGAYRFPAIILVSPEGKIVGMNLRGEKIAEAVANALEGRGTTAGVKG